MTVTRDDVASLAGVSTATVSYVMNNGPRRVTDNTRRKVERAIDKLGYQPSAVARSLKTKKTMTIGIVIPDIRNPIFAFIAQTIEDELVPAGYNLILCNTKELSDRETRYVEMLIRKQVDGLVIAPTLDNHNIVSSLLRADKPIVLLDRVVEGLNAHRVLFDNEGGAFEAVSHLISLGHKRIGMISLPVGLTPGSGRLQGYRSAMQQAGLSFDPTLVKTGSSTAENAHALAEAVLGLDRPPTALFVSSNRLARGVLMFVKEHRLNMPDDLALCVFDDIGHYSYVNPSITAVAHDYRQFGLEAAKLLMADLNGDTRLPPQVIRLPHRLNVRESTIGKNPIAGGDQGELLVLEPKSMFGENYWD